MWAVHAEFDFGDRPVIRNPCTNQMVRGDLANAWSCSYCAKPVSRYEQEEQNEDDEKHNRPLCIGTKHSVHSNLSSS
jgi:hypothetical protein